MSTEIAVALIGLAGSVLTALISSRREVARSSKPSKPQARAGRPGLVFASVLGVGLALTAIFFAYVTTKREEPQEVSRGTVHQNTSGRAAFVTLFCNSTVATKDMEAKVGSSPDALQLVASESGRDRMSASVVVPAGWYYQVNVNEVPGLGCNFQRWPL